MPAKLFVVVHVDAPENRRVGTSMPKSMVGLLTAVGGTMFALVPFAHNVLILLAIAVGAAAAGLAAYATLCPVPGRSHLPVASLTENKKKSLMSVTCPLTM
jgi:hypothetical protein